MTKNKAFFAFIILLLGIFLFNEVSAQENCSNFTIILGKVYKGNFNEAGSGVNVVVTCNGFSIETTTKNDGSYGIKFDRDLYPCLQDQRVTVSATKDTWSGTKEGSVRAYESEDSCEVAEFISIINVRMQNSNSSSSSSEQEFNSRTSRTRLVFNCGNNICDSGETKTTCPQDCNIKEESQSLTNLTTNKTGNNNKEIESEEKSNEQKSVFSALTGAVIGAITAYPPMAFIIVCVIIILTALVIVNVRQAKFKNK